MQILHRFYPWLTSTLLAACFVLGSNFALYAQTTVTPKNLPAPTISKENPIETLSKQVQLAWDNMDDAQSYYFVLCTDTRCSKPLRVIKDLKSPEVTLNNLPIQSLFWQVSAVDVQGTIGTPSNLQPLIVLEKIDTANSKIIEKNQTKKLPWYIWLIFFCYTIFLLRIIYWRLNR